MDVYAQDFAVQIKDDASPLTQADLAANRVIVEGLRRVTPDVPVLSEESAHVAWEDRQFWTSYWLVDPLDGTREFVKRNGEFSVNIALIHMGAPVLGVVQAPVDGRVWYAARGENAYRRDGDRDEMLHTRTPAATPLRVAASRSHRDARTAAALERMGEIDVVAQGSSLKFCRIAEGDLTCIRASAPPPNGIPQPASACCTPPAVCCWPAAPANRSVTTAATPCSMAISSRWAIPICRGAAGWCEHRRPPLARSPVGSGGCAQSRCSHVQWGPCASAAAR